MGSFKRQDLLPCSSKTSYKVFRERTLRVYGRIFYQDDGQVGEDLIPNSGLLGFICLFFFFLLKHSNWDTFPLRGELDYGSSCNFFGNKPRASRPLITRSTTVSELRCFPLVFSADYFESWNHRLTALTLKMKATTIMQNHSYWRHEICLFQDFVIKK